MNDSDLLSAIGSGDRDAFTEFYDRHVNQVYRYCRVRLRDHHLTSDVCQETMLTVWRTARKYKAEGTPIAWLFGIAFRKVQSVWRKYERLPIPLTLEDIISAADRSTTVIDEMTEQIALFDCLSRLPPEQQDAILLVYYNGLSCKEVAQITGVPEGTVKSRLFHARRSLQSSLTR